MSGTVVVASTAYSHDAANQLVLASDGNSAYAFTFSASKPAISCGSGFHKSLVRTRLSGLRSSGCDMIHGLL
jgi:hypothetical protein